MKVPESRVGICAQELPQIRLDEAATNIVTKYCQVM